MLERIIKETTRVLHVLAAGWLVMLAVIIFIDVIGRWLFNNPLAGTAEIVANSIVAIAFLQTPFAIRTHSMLQTTVVLDQMGPEARKWAMVIVYVLGIIFFLALAVSSWDLVVRSWLTNEYFGEGALRVPTFPTRAIIMLMGVLSALAYLLLLVQEIAGRSTQDDKTVPY